MNTAVARTFHNSRRVILVNPTKYLGNLLLSGGLIQDFLGYCRRQDKALLIVLDEGFRELVTGALPEDNLLFYPRRRIKQGAAAAAQGYLRCLGRIRRWRADLAFTLEEDAVCHRLTQFSGAGFVLGCSPQRHGRGFDHVLPLAFARDREPGRRHRWYSFQEVFAALGLPPSPPAYMRLAPPPFTDRLADRLAAAGVDLEHPCVVIHAGATKAYKRWHTQGFGALCEELLARGVQPLLIGAGEEDRRANQQVLEQLSPAAHGEVADLGNRLSLAELASVLTTARAMVGNDSGPLHLASALGVPGVVLFGPTDQALWRPLGDTSAVVTGSQPCTPQCSRRHCPFDYRCLASITPAMIMTELERLAALAGKLQERSGQQPHDNPS